MSAVAFRLATVARKFGVLECHVIRFSVAGDVITVQVQVQVQVHVEQIKRTNRYHKARKGLHDALSNGPSHDETEHLLDAYASIYAAHI
jgi:hypothetical protein